MKEKIKEYYHMILLTVLGMEFMQRVFEISASTL
jgi:hypothetical protein